MAKLDLTVDNLCKCVEKIADNSVLRFLLLEGLFFKLIYEAGKFALDIAQEALRESNSSGVFVSSSSH